MGVDAPSEILFVTDVYQEATAAKAAGKKTHTKLYILFTSKPIRDSGFKETEFVSQFW